jgi:hypothetical protein
VVKATGPGGQGGLQGGTAVRAAGGQAGDTLPGATGNDATTDFDGDGVKDVSDACPGVDARPADANGDGCPDRPAKLLDADGDGIPNGADACPALPRGATDADEDGCPDPAPAVGGGPAPAGGGGAAGGGAPVVQRDPERILVIIGFAFNRSTARFTKFTRLQVKGVPVAATVRVACTAPKGAKCPAKRFTKANAFGNVTLAKWVGKKLAVGTRLTVTVTRAGNFIGAVKVLTVRKRRAPTIGTRCLPPGAATSVGC